MYGIFFFVSFAIALFSNSVDIIISHHITLENFPELLRYSLWAIIYGYLTFILFAATFIALVVLFNKTNKLYSILIICISIGIFMTLSMSRAYRLFPTLLADLQQKDVVMTTYGKCSVVSGLYTYRRGSRSRQFTRTFLQMYGGTERLLLGRERALALAEFEPAPRIEPCPYVVEVKYLKHSKIVLDVRPLQQ